ncbi:hypothetical protein Dsin_010408 [Dipteronia sinensis]|nr:hypothetical protein Dsin_010408 [Dipteronia sinensis]
MAKCMLAGTMLLGAAKLLHRRNCETVFQPADEGGAGASYMVKEGVLGDSEAIICSTCRRWNTHSHRNYSIHFMAIVGRCEHGSSKNRGTRSSFTPCYS